MIDPDEALRNILHVLQEKPRNYRCFGWWWWPVKRLLKTRYSADNLYYLGDYCDDEALAGVPADLDEAGILARALAEYVPNEAFGMTSRAVADIDGNRYIIDDPDSGGL